MSVVSPQLKVISDPAEFQALQDEWDELWSRAHGRHHQSFTVCLLCWLRVAQPRGRQLRIILLRENGRLVAVWPLVTYRKYCWTVLRPLSPEAADYTSILAEDGPLVSAWIAQMWRAAHRQCAPDVIHLPYVSVDSELHGLVAGQSRVMVAERHSSATAKLRTETDWGTYCSSLGTLSGRKPGALQRRLAKEGALEFRVLGTDDAVENAGMVDWMLACKREWASRVNKKGDWLYSPEYRNFLVDLLNQTEDETLARLLVVSLDGAPVAVSMIGLGKTCVNGIIGGFDPRHAKLAPASVATEHWIKWALEQGFDIDMGIGAETFKAYWSRGNFAAVCSMQIANTRWGVLAFAANKLQQAFSSAMSGFSEQLRSRGPGAKRN